MVIVFALLYFTEISAFLNHHKKYKSFPLEKEKSPAYRRYRRQVTLCINKMLLFGFLYRPANAILVCYFSNLVTATYMRVTVTLCENRHLFENPQHKTHTNPYSTVTLFAKFLGLSTSQPRYTEI